MKITSQIILAASFLFLVSCSENKKANTTQGVGTAPVNFSGKSTGAQAAPGATAGLNPEHGQPGHRCDIPVGSPLSAPAQPNTAAPATLPIPTPAPTTTNTATAPGTNPPHGQPGHDCAVPVGAPLNK